MQFDTNGLDALILDMDEMDGLPDAVATEMLQAGGEVVVAAQKKQIAAVLHVRSGKLADSITVNPKMRRGHGDDERYVLVYPYGDHHVYGRRLVTKSYKRSKSGRTYTVGGGEGTATNNDVGFVLEVGAKKRNIKAYGWMRDANEQCADAAVDAEFKVYDAYLKQKGF